MLETKRTNNVWTKKNGPSVEISPHKIGQHDGRRLAICHCIYITAIFRPIRYCTIWTMPASHSLPGMVICLSVQQNKHAAGHELTVISTNTNISRHQSLCGNIPILIQLLGKQMPFNQTYILCVLNLRAVMMIKS